MNRIRVLRTNAGLSMAEFAERAGASVDVVRHWERGFSNPRSAYLTRVADVLGVTVDLLFRDEMAAPAMQEAGDTDDVQLGARIRRLRRSLLLRQEDVAQSLRLAQSTVGHWECGWATPTSTYLPALARTLRCSIDYLLTGRESGFPTPTRNPHDALHRALRARG